MRIRLQEKDETRLHMAPMIDMVFLLVIFFMTASHLSSSQSLRLALPTATKGAVPESRPDRWVVNIMQDGSLYSGDRPVTIEELKRLVSARAQADPNLKAYLRADANSAHKHVKAVMNAMAGAGVSDFIFGVYSPQPEETQ